LYLIVLALVLLHELGHALAAAACPLAWPRATIVLLPIGGIARLERLPARIQSGGRHCPGWPGTSTDCWPWDCWRGNGFTDDGPLCAG